MRKPNHNSLRDSNLLGGKIKEIRTNLRLTLDDVAKSTKLTSGFLSALENSRTTCSFETVQKLVKCFGDKYKTPLQLTWFQERGFASIKLSKQNNCRDEVAIRLSEVWSALTDEDLSKIANVVGM